MSHRRSRTFPGSRSPWRAGEGDLPVCWPVRCHSGRLIRRGRQTSTLPPAITRHYARPRLRIPIRSVGIHSRQARLPAETRAQSRAPSIVMTGHDYAQGRISMRYENALSSCMSGSSGVRLIRLARLRIVTRRPRRSPAPRARLRPRWAGQQASHRCSFGSWGYLPQPAAISGPGPSPRPAISRPKQFKPAQLTPICQLPSAAPTLTTAVLQPGYLGFRLNPA